MKPILLSLLLAIVVFLSACSPKTIAQSPVGAATEAISSPTQTESVPTVTPPSEQDWTRIDQQGAVVVDVTPLDLAQPGQTLNFQVSMDTHSVDLSMDLLPLATLTTETGLEIQAVSWDGPGGGHHVSGTLSFPSTVDGKPLLEEASLLTLTIRSVDAEARIFTWSINH
jgi:hypothetical protein